MTHTLPDNPVTRQLDVTFAVMFECLNRSNRPRCEKVGLKPCSTARP